jgi:succinate dehydrogenase flavin-adding protein (antitoxin of CptAB toxin-antitoxin module)
MEENENKKKEFQEKLTESQLDALYFYIEMNTESMTDDELKIWKEMLEKLDSKFYEH